MGRPEERAVHGPVNPVETEVGKNKPEEYLHPTGEPVDAGHRECHAQVDCIEPVSEERLPYLSRDGSHSQCQNVQRQIAAPFYGVTGADAFQGIEEQNDYDKCCSLIELLFFTHDLPSIV